MSRIPVLDESRKKSYRANVVLSAVDYDKIKALAKLADKSLTAYVSDIARDIGAGKYDHWIAADNAKKTVGLQKGANLIALQHLSDLGTKTPMTSLISRAVLLDYERLIVEETEVTSAVTEAIEERKELLSTIKKQEKKIKQLEKEAEQLKKHNKKLKAQIAKVAVLLDLTKGD